MLCMLLGLVTRYNLWYKQRGLSIAKPCPIEISIFYTDVQVFVGALYITLRKKD